MAILLAESFDGYTNLAAATAALQSVANDAVYNTTGGRWGGGAWKSDGLDNGVRVLLKASPATNLVRVAFHIKLDRDHPSSVSGARALLKLRNSASTRFLPIYCSGSSAGSGIGSFGACFIAVGAYDDADSLSVSLTVGSIPVMDGRWHHVEMEFVASTTVGVCKVWIDGILDINISGDTSDAASLDVTAFDRVDLCGGLNNGGTPNVFMDDPLVWDDSGTDFTGHLGSPHRLRNVLVNAAGTTTQFTPNTGANNAAVDEATFDDDTTYVESNTVGHIDLYNVGTVGATLQTIRGVLVETIAKDTGAARTHRELLRSNVTTSNGTTHPTLANAYRKYQSFYSLDPNGAIAWTQTNIEASQIGQEVIS